MVEYGKVEGADICLFDVETTGRYPGRDQIIQFSSIHVNSEEEDLEKSVVGYYNEYFELYKGISNSTGAFAVHGLSKVDLEVLADEKKERDIIPIIERVRGMVMGAYCGHFDMKFLGAAYRREGRDMGYLNYVNTAKGLPKRVNDHFPRKKSKSSYKLKYLYDLTLELQGRSHEYYNTMYERLFNIEAVAHDALFDNFMQLVVSKYLKHLL